MGTTELPTISVSAAVCSPSPSDTSSAPSHASLHQSKPTPQILEDGSCLATQSCPLCRKQACKSWLSRGAAPPGFAAGSRACCMVEVAIPALPSTEELLRSPFLPSPLLSSSCPPSTPLVCSAAAPARAPDALTTAVGLIIKITF